MPPIYSMMPQNGLIKLDKDANMDYNDRGNLTIFIMISLVVILIWRIEIYYDRLRNWGHRNYRCIPNNYDIVLDV